MAEPSLPIPASEGDGEWQDSVAPTVADDEQRSPSVRKEKSIAATIRRFLELRHAANQEGFSVVFDELCAEGAGTGVRAQKIGCYFTTNGCDSLRELRLLPRPQSHSSAFSTLY